MAITTFVEKNYTVIFKGDAFESFETVEEIVIAEMHKNKVCEEKFEKFIALFNKRIALLKEGITSMSCQQNVHLKKNISIFGWDSEEVDKINENRLIKLINEKSERGSQIRKSFININELEKILNSDTLSDELRLKYETLYKQKKHQFESLVLKKKGNWDLVLKTFPARTASMIKTLNIFDTLRSLKKSCANFGVSFNYEFSFPVTILKCGYSHAINTPQYPNYRLNPELSLDTLYAILKQRNAAILCPPHVFQEINT